MSRNKNKETKLDKNIEEEIIKLLALIYNKIPWKKINTSKNAHDVFNHRVRSASRRKNIQEFVTKLCNYFSIQSLPSECTDYIENLRSVEQIVLDKINKEHIPICVKSIVYAKKNK